jgi:hypothetical protein
MDAGSASLVEVLNVFILVRNCHALQILVIPDCLKVSANQKQVDLVTISLLQLLNMIVNGVKFAVTTALHCNLLKKSFYR